VPIFHNWIQKQILNDHVLIDVHDYSHIHHGPGILLVSHEANFSMDMGGGRLGLVYDRKRPIDASPEEAFAGILGYAHQASRLLEEEPSLEPRLSFLPDELLITISDRLHAPNTPETFAQFEPILTGGLKRFWPGTEVRLTPADPDPKERFAVRAHRSTPARYDI
jgi:hypothetical protein